MSECHKENPKYKCECNDCYAKGFFKIVEIDATNCDDILEELKGKVFFAVSIDRGDYRLHAPDFLLKSQLIFGLEIIRQIIMQESFDNFEEENK